MKLNISKNKNRNGKPKLERTNFIEAIKRLSIHDHLCLLYKNQSDQFDAVVPFIKTGLENNEKCVYIADDNTAEVVIAMLKMGGVNTAKFLNSGALTVVSKHETYLKKGYFNPDEMIGFLKESTEEAVQQGFSALRATGEMTWMLGGDPGSSRLLEYESKLNNFFPKYPCLALCQYNLNRFGLDILLDVLYTHPFVVMGSKICKNYYYVPVKKFLREGVNKIAKVERLFDVIAEREKIEDKLKTNF